MFVLYFSLIWETHSDIRFGLIVVFINTSQPTPTAINDRSRKLSIPSKIGNFAWVTWLLSWISISNVLHKLLIYNNEPEKISILFIVNSFDFCISLYFFILKHFSPHNPAWSVSFEKTNSFSFWIHRNAKMESAWNCACNRKMFPKLCSSIFF